MSQDSSKSDEHYRALNIFKEIGLISIGNRNKGISVVETYTSEDVKKFLKNRSSVASQKKLRKISRFLLSASGHYQNLILYFSTLHTMDYTLPPMTTDIGSINPKRFKKDYEEHAKTTEKMDISSSFLEARITSYVDGVFYGFARPTKNGFYLQKLDPDYCKITFIDPDTGLLGYSFDFSYFNNNIAMLNSFPEYFREIYGRTKDNKSSTEKWERIESPLSICLTTSFDFNPVPAFSSVFEGILDIADFKALAKTKEELENFMLLLQKIPMDGKDANKFLIDEDYVKTFHENLLDISPEQVGVSTSPMDITAVKFDKDTYDKNKVGQATTQFWDETGVSNLLFSANASTSSALKYSVGTDESDAFRLIKVIEKWCNAYVQATGNYRYGFKLNILPATKLNRNELIESALKLANAGLPKKTEIMALGGYSPNAILMNAYLENEILKLPDVLVPLSSAHTATPSDLNGRPKSQEEDLSDKGLQTRDNESNEED